MSWWRRSVGEVVLVLSMLAVLFLPVTALDGFNRVDLALILFLSWIILCTIQARRSWRCFTQPEKNRYFKRVIVFLSATGFFILLMAADFVLQRVYSIDRLLLHGASNNGPGYELHTLDLYPYTGFHQRANCRVRGAMPVEANPYYSDFDVQSGDHGFFVDFDLDDPPAKEPGEFRIILIGGSAAQGFGAQTNEHMIYRVLEKTLQKAQPGRLRVINLAQGNSTSYQNFIALNKWGHGLEPDLILSFSGVNDAVVPLMMGEADMPYRFHSVVGLTRSTWVTENPRLLDDLAKYFPSLNNSLLGVAVRVLRSPAIGLRARAEYNESYRHAHAPTPEMYPAQAFIHAMKSIKRDFQGIPMVIAFQPHLVETEGFIVRYDNLVDKACAELKDYRNDRWTFIKIQDRFWERGLLHKQTFIGGVHLPNHGQQAAAEVLAAELAPLIARIRARTEK